jgi:hypothetical protein
LLSQDGLHRLAATRVATMNAARVHDEQKVDILFDRDLNFVAADEMGGRRESCSRPIKPIPEQAKEKACSFLKKRTKKLLLFEFCPVSVAYSKNRGFWANSEKKQSVGNKELRAWMLA